MSGVPTSAVDSRELEALVRAGWRESDLVWERLQESAGERNAAGDLEGVAALWAKALRLAREEFADNDPRLAASLTNHALALRRAGNGDAARALFDEALLVWDSSAPWVAALAPERRARSSTFHLRLETKHPGGYARHSRERTAALAAEGRAALMALRGGGEAPGHNLFRWEKDRPDGFTDARKFMAAALLIAARAD